MIKLINTIFLIIFMGYFVSGCGVKNPPEPPPEQKSMLKQLKNARVLDQQTPGDEYSFSQEDIDIILAYSKEM